MIQTREKSILEAIIREYIRTAEPVSSKRIAEQAAHLDFSPATIRNVMADLTEQGYITQPHTSAGRMPTQKGYRFFVDHCMRTLPASPQLEDQLRQAEDWQECVRLITQRTHLFTIVALEDDSAFFNFGMGEVLGRPEFENHDVVHRFGYLIDALFENLDVYRYALDSHVPQVFIEEENPIPEAAFVSVVAVPMSGNSIVLTVGPSRMDYESVINIHRDLTSITLRI